MSPNHRRNPASWAHVATLATALCLPCLSFAPMAHAAPVAAQATLQAQLKQAPQRFTVVEPHLTVKGQHTQVTYVG